MISFDKVSKSYAKQDILRDCSFQVNPGERVGLIGANGSGKTTVFKLLMGFDHPDQGQITKPKHLRLGYLPQDVLQFHGKTVLEQVMDVAEEVQTIETELSLLTDLLEQPLSKEALAKTAERQSRLLEEYQRLGGYELEARARKVLGGLGFDEDDMPKPVEEIEWWLGHASCFGPHPPGRARSHLARRAYQPPRPGFTHLARGVSRSDSIITHTCFPRSDVSRQRCP